MKINPFENYKITSELPVRINMSNLLASAVPEINWYLKRDYGDYQGENFYFGIIPTTGKYYFVSMYYGSCSGCDELLEAEVNGNYALIALKDKYKSRIYEFDSIKEFEDWVNKEYIKPYSSERISNFLKDLKEYEKDYYDFEEKDIQLVFDNY